MISAKIAFIFVVGLVALFSGIIGILSDYTSFDDKVRDIVKDIVKAPTGYFLAMKSEQKTVEFTATLSASSEWNLPFSFTTSPEKITIEYDDSSSDLEINTLSMTAKGENEVVLYEYRGKAMVTDKLTIDGSADKAVVNSVEIKNPEKRISIDTINLDYTIIKFEGLPATSLNLRNVTGEIIAEGENYDITYNLENQKIEISGFTGTLSVFENQLTLDGTGTIKTESLLAPTY